MYFFKSRFAAGVKSAKNKDERKFSNKFLFNSKEETLNIHPQCLSFFFEGISNGCTSKQFLKKKVFFIHWNICSEEDNNSG